MKHSRKETQKQHDLRLIESTQRVLAEPYFTKNGMQSLEKILPTPTHNTSTRTLFKPQRCYICKNHFRELHHFYHRLCPLCAEKNYTQRTSTADLKGHVALITGGRIKIGYQIALMLLRAGAKVIISTRFSHDAASRYRQEADFTEWAERLTIYRLDLRHIPSIECFTHYLHQQYGHLDIIINNAAQTLRKPQQYYLEMAKREQKVLQPDEQQLLGRFNDKLLEQEQKQQLHYEVANKSQDNLEYKTPNNIKNDEFGEPIDFSPRNSWVETLDSVDTLELVETQVINTMAPFLLNSRLKPLMINSPNAQRFIINVSAMEGQFNRKNKTHRHPHTNMAKAALNMMTRTSASDYAKDNIYMNSVDTGWVTQENPFPIKQKSRKAGMVPPLDCIDGSARVLAPIFNAINGETAKFGCFFKDYEETHW